MFDLLLKFELPVTCFEKLGWQCFVIAFKSDIVVVVRFLILKTFFFNQLFNFIILLDNLNVTLGKKNSFLEFLVYNVQVKFSIDLRFLLWGDKNNYYSFNWSTSVRLFDSYFKSLCQKYC